MHQATKVLLIITRLIRGGAQREVLELLDRLDPRRFRVALACHPGAEWVPKGIELADAFYPVPDLVRAVSPRKDLRARKQLVSIMRRERPHIVHTHTAKAGTLGRLAARLTRVPVILHTPHGTVFHETYLSPRMQRVVAVLERLNARWTDRIVTKSQFEADEYISRGIAPPGKFVTIHSGLDLARLDEVRTRSDALRRLLGISDGRPMVLYPARFVAEKDHPTFIAAFEKALATVPEAVAVLAGEGPLRTEAERRTAHLTARGSLVFAGFRDDLPDLMRAADVCVSASLTEGLPLTVAEALALGRPVVATDAGGTREVVRNGETGVLVPCGDADALAEGMLAVLRDPGWARELGEAGRRHVRPMFDARTMVRQIEALYDECLVRKGLTQPSPTRQGGGTGAR